MEILPVSSETTIIIASLLSDIPIAALCLVPRLGSTSMRLVKGKKQPAAAILPSEITTAPSCKGALLKNKFLKSKELTSALRITPVGVISESLVVPSITISAPTDSLDKASAAFVMLSIALT